MVERVDSNTYHWTKAVKRLHCAPREVHRGRSRGVDGVYAARFVVIPSEVEGPRGITQNVTPRDSSTKLRSARKDT